ncbi:hypothetical protein D9M70_573040 [compost metagenome]
MLYGAEHQHGGVVHQHVDASVTLDGGAHHVLPVFLAADIQALEAGRFAQFRREGLAFLFQEIGDDHVGAFGDEQARGFGAHAAGATGEDGNLVSQTLHVNLLV